MKKNKIDIYNIILDRLENAELSEALHDEFFQNTTLPILKDTGIMKKFGMLSQDQQDQMMHNSFAIDADTNNPTKWTQIFFGSVLSKEVRLSTFLSSVDIVKQEAYYTNYKYNTYLQESPNIDVSLGSRGGDILFLKDPNEMKAYVRTGNRNLYISSSVSGKYKDYITASNNPQSFEGKKLKTFASSILNQVKDFAITDMLKVFNTPEEKQMLENFKTSSTMYNVLLDSITLALVDLLNQGTYSRNYGSTFQAGQALLGNNLLTEQPNGYTSLININPNAIKDISNKLKESLTHINPYMVDIRVLNAAFVKARSSQNIFSGVINRFASAFSDMVSVLGKSIGATKVNFDELMTSNDKASLLLQLTQTGEIFQTTNTGTEHLRNPFIRIVSKRMSSGNHNGYALVADIAHGIAFSKTEGIGLVATDFSSKDIKTAFLPFDAHEHVVNETLKNYQAISGELYSNVFETLETKSDTQANIGQGGSKATKAQLLDILKYLFDDSSKELKTDIVLLAVIPKLIVQSAVIGDMLVTDKKINNTGYVLEQLFRSSTNEHKKEAEDILHSLKPIKDIYNEYMNIMLEYNSTPEQFIELKTRFINLAKNLRNGIWSSSALIGFAVFSAINENIKYELRLSDDVINGDIEASKKEALSMLSQLEIK